MRGKQQAQVLMTGERRNAGANFQFRSGNRIAGPCRAAQWQGASTTRRMSLSAWTRQRTPWRRTCSSVADPAPRVARECPVQCLTLRRVNAIFL